jgi:VIT1/CCC1 family predicted Fe2+/Mn2+ transporter
MFGVAVLIATFVHWRLKNIILASFISLVISPFAFFAVSALHDGLPKHAAWSDLLVLGAMAVPPTIIVGLVFWLLRWRVKNG